MRSGESLWGEPPAVKKYQPSIIKFVPWRNAAGTVRGFVSVQLASGLIIHDLKLMVSNRGQHWIGFPAQKQLRDGNPVLDPNGKPIWSPLVEIPDKATRDRFTAMVLDLLRISHAAAFDNGGEP